MNDENPKDASNGGPESDGPATPKLRSPGPNPFSKARPAGLDLPKSASPGGPSKPKLSLPSLGAKPSSNPFAAKPAPAPEAPAPAPSPTDDDLPAPSKPAAYDDLPAPSAPRVDALPDADESPTAFEPQLFDPPAVHVTATGQESPLTDDGGLDEDSEGDAPTSNLSGDEAGAIDAMLQESASTWNDEDDDDEFEGESTMMVDSSFEVESAPSFDAPGFEAPGLEVHTEVEVVDELEDEALVELQEDSDVDPTTDIPAEDVQSALRMSGAFGASPRPEASKAPRTQMGMGAIRAPSPTPMFGASSLPSPAPSPEHVSRAPAPAAPVEDVDDMTIEVALPDDVPETEAGFQAQSTELLDSVFEREEIAPRLNVTQGPAMGREYFARELRVTVGRGEGNTIQLPDPALSRTHFEICRNPDESFTLRDLDSANGTYLNGQRIKEASLFHGDSIEIGKSVTLFDCPSAAPRGYRHLVPAATETVAGAMPLDEHTRLATLELDQSTRLFTRIAVGASVVGVLACVALVALIATSDSPEPEPVSPVVVEAPSSKAQKLYMSGVDAVKQREWDEARGLFEQARSSNPKLDVSAQLERIEREKKASKTLTDARSLATAGKLDEAQKLAADIPDTSVYYDDASELRRQKKRVELSALIERAQAQFTADELDAALASIDEILERQPDHAGARELRPRILARKDELARQAEAAAAAAAAAANTGDPDPFGTKPAGDSSAPIASSGNLDEGYALYKKRNFSQAAAFFSGSGHSKGKALASAVRTLDREWGAAKSAKKKKNWKRAARSFERARSADRKLKGSHRSALNDGLAGVRGEEGLALLKAKKYRDARRKLIDGEKLSKSNTSVKSLNRALERAATSLYIRAANKKKTDPAAASEICRTIMKMVPSSSPSWQKAKKLALEP